MPVAPSSAKLPVPYRQPFANPGRNSAEPASVRDGSAPKMQPVLTAQAGYVGAAIDWLIGGGDADELVLFESRMAHGWWVDLQNRRKVVLVGTEQGSFPVFQEDAEQLILPRGGMLVLPDMAAPDDYDRWQSVGAGGLDSPVHALIARRDHFTVASLRPPNHGERYTTIEITSKGYSEGALGDVRWQQNYPSEESAPSPALSDGTLVLCLRNRLRFFAPDGAGAIDPAIGIMQGKVVAEVAAALRAGLVSVDALDRVWGFRVADGALIGWDAQGQAVGPALTLDVTPAQPPVALPGGALAIVAPGAVLKIENGRVSWRAVLPPDGQPLATADRSGQLLVRAGQHLLLLDTAGKQVWSSELPAAITSNPLITNAGRLCVAAGLTLYCSP